MVFPLHYGWTYPRFGGINLVQDASRSQYRRTGDHFLRSQRFRRRTTPSFISPGALGQTSSAGTDAGHAGKDRCRHFGLGWPRLVGFGRVLTDYVYRATIWDVIVDRNYQGRKIGTEIVRRISTIPPFSRSNFSGCARACRASTNDLGSARKNRPAWSGPERGRSRDARDPIVSRFPSFLYSSKPRQINRLTQCRRYVYCG